MSYEESDDRPEEVTPDEPWDLEGRFGADMVDAVREVIVNIFGERWDDDDEQRAFAVLTEKYTSIGYAPWQVRRYAQSSAPGYYWDAIDGVTHEVIFDAGLINP